MYKSGTMNNSKGFVSAAVLIGIFVVLALGGAGYVAMNPEVVADFKGEIGMMNDDGVQTEPGDHPEVDREADGSVSVDAKSSIVWRFADAGEIDAMPRTKVTVLINGKAYDGGTHLGSCSEIGATGGVDGKGLLIGELSAAQCWFAGGGKEIGVFAHEDGGLDIMVGELSEGEAGEPLFRGDFTITNTIQL